jgi:hypothetical protein
MAPEWTRRSACPGRSVVGNVMGIAYSFLDLAAQPGSVPRVHPWIEKPPEGGVPRNQQKR